MTAVQYLSNEFKRYNINMPVGLFESLTDNALIIELQQTYKFAERYHYYKKIGKVTCALDYVKTEIIAEFNK
jgi:hypothetical protein